MKRQEVDRKKGCLFRKDLNPLRSYGREDPDMMAAFEGCTHSGGKGKKLRKASKRPARSLGTTKWVQFLSKGEFSIFIHLHVIKLNSCHTVTY